VPTTLQSLVGFAPANFNMLPWGAFSQATDFSTIYTLTGATVTSGVTSPSGLTNAQKLVEDTSFGNHRVFSFGNPRCTTSSQCIFRVVTIAQSAGRTRIVVASETYLNETAISASVGFDLSGGNTNYSNATGTQTSIVGTPSMTSLGNGWWLCKFDYQYTGAYLGNSCVMQPKIYIDNGSGTAARSISYAGNGSSGINLWWFNLMPVGAWSITSTTPVFQDDFDDLSGFDMGDTRAPGFKWYIGNNAPNSINPTWWAPGVLPASLPGNFTISSPSILAVNSGGSNWQSMFYSVAFPASGGFVGTAWQAPMLFDGYFSWDNSIHKTAAYWGHAVEPMAGSIAPSAHWREWDWIDSGATLSSINDEYVSGGSPIIINRSNGAGWIGLNMAIGSFHRLSGLALSIADNGNTFGTLMSFFDGMMVPYSDVAYSASENQPPSVNPNQVLLASFESQHQPIMFDIQNIGSFTGGPAYIDWMRVYQSGSNQPLFRHSKLGTRVGSRQVQ
jgi:hypothetical protein